MYQREHTGGPKVAAREVSDAREDRMSSGRLRRALSVAAITGLTVMALSVVAGTVVESRGPAADQLPQVSLSTPDDTGTIVAEVTTSSSASAPTSAPSAPAPTTTTASVLVVQSSPPRSYSAVGGRVTQPAATTARPTATTARPATTQSPAPTTTVRTVPRPVPTATTVPRTTVTTTKTSHGEKTTTTLRASSTTTTTSRASSTTATTDHVVVPPTVRDDDD